MAKKNQIMRAVVGIDASKANAQLDQLEKNFQDIKKELTGVVNVNKKLERSNKKLSAEVDRLNKKLAQTGAATKKQQANVGGYTKSMGRTNAAISNASFALQDFITVMQGGGGFERAVLSTTNNLGMMATMLMGPWSGAIAGVSAALVSAAIPAVKSFMFANEESTEEIEANKEALESWNESAAATIKNLEDLGARAMNSADAITQSEIDAVKVAYREASGAVGGFEDKIFTAVTAQEKISDAIGFTTAQLKEFMDKGMKPTIAMGDQGLLSGYMEHQPAEFQKFKELQGQIIKLTGQLDKARKVLTKTSERQAELEGELFLDRLRRLHMRELDGVRQQSEDLKQEREDRATEAAADSRKTEVTNAKTDRASKKKQRELDTAARTEKKIRETTEQQISEILDDEDEREIRSLKILRDSLASKIDTVEVDGQRLVDAIKALNAKLDALDKKQEAKKAGAAAAVPPTGRGRGGRARPGIDALAAEQARRKAAGMEPLTRKERREFLTGKAQPVAGGFIPDIPGDVDPRELHLPVGDIPGVVPPAVPNLVEDGVPRKRPPRPPLPPFPGQRPPRTGTGKDSGAWTDEGPGFDDGSVTATSIKRLLNMFSSSKSSMMGNVGSTEDPGFGDRKDSLINILGRIWGGEGVNKVLPGAQEGLIGGAVASPFGAVLGGLAGAAFGGPLGAAAGAPLGAAAVGSGGAFGGALTHKILEGIGSPSDYKKDDQRLLATLAKLLKLAGVTTKNQKANVQLSASLQARIDAWQGIIDQNTNDISTILSNPEKVTVRSRRQN